MSKDNRRHLMVGQVVRLEALGDEATLLQRCCGSGPPRHMHMHTHMHMHRPHGHGHMVTRIRRTSRQTDLGCISAVVSADDAGSQRGGRTFKKKC